MKHIDDVVEMAVLGSTMAADTMPTAEFLELSPEDFADHGRATIFSAMREAAERRLIPNEVNVCTVLREWEVPREMALQSVACEIADRWCLTTVNVAAWVAELRRLSDARRCVSGLSDAARDVAREVTADGAVQLARDRARALATGPEQSRGLESVADITLRVFRDLEQRTHNPTPAIATGYRDLDAFTGGIRPGSLIVVGGRPGMGKTAHALGAMRHIAGLGLGPALVFSLEMSAGEMSDRLVSLESNVPLRRIIEGPADTDWSKIANALSRIKQLDLRMLDGNLPMSRIVSVATDVAMASGRIGAIMIDYAQLVPGPRQDRRDLEVGEVSRTAKLMAMELKCPVFLLSQLNRASEKRGDNRPTLSDLRESGALEQDANQAWLLYRAAVHDAKADKSEAEVIVAKNRSGPTGIVNLRWDGPTASYR